MLAHQLNIAHTATKGKTETDGWQTAGTMSGGIPAVVGASGTQTYSGTSQQALLATYQNIPMLAALKKLTENHIALLIDDFHYIPTEVQRAIIQALKGPVFRGLSVILLAVPHRAF